MGVGICLHKHNTTQVLFFMLESVLVGIHNQTKYYPNCNKAKCNIQNVWAALFLIKLKCLTKQHYNEVL